jgi:hypothetical protein
MAGDAEDLFVDPLQIIDQTDSEHRSRAGRGEGAPTPACRRVSVSKWLNLHARFGPARFERQNAR